MSDGTITQWGGAASTITEDLFFRDLPIGLCLLLLLNGWLSFIYRWRGDCRPLLFGQLKISLCRIDQEGPVLPVRERTRSI